MNYLSPKHVATKCMHHLNSLRTNQAWTSIKAVNSTAKLASGKYQLKKNNNGTLVWHPSSTFCCCGRSSIHISNKPDWFGDGRGWHESKILPWVCSSNPLQSTAVTFLMPNDEKLSEVVVTPEHLHDFILSHLIPTVLLNNNLLHFPNGTLVPSSQPGRMLSITNSGKLGVYVNNARLVNFNVCMNSQLKSHGISSSITFDSPISSSQSMASLKRHGRVYQLEILYYL